MFEKHSSHEAEEFAALYAAGSLSERQRRTFEDHLGECEACRREWALLSPVVEQLFAAPQSAIHEELGPATLQALLAAIDREQDESRRSPLLDHLGDPSIAGAATDFAQETAPITQRAGDGKWEATAAAGVSMRVLSIDRDKDQFMALVRMAAGATYPRHIHRGAEHCLVLEGELDVGGEILGPGDYQLSPEGTRHEVQTTRTGCLLMITSSLHDEFETTI